VSELALGPRLGIGKEAEVFACGAGVVKLYRPTAPKHAPFREAAILAVVEALGLPAPVVHGVQRFGDRWGVLMSRAMGPTFAKAMAGEARAVPGYLNRLAHLHLHVHGHSGTRFASLKARLATNIRAAPLLCEQRRDALLEGLATMADRDRLCHGDFHPYNVMGPPHHEVLIDWLDASCGDPAADVCRSYVLLRPMSPDLAVAYVDAYVRVSGESRDGILRWLPFVAAARLAEGVPEVNELLEMVGT